MTVEEAIKGVVERDPDRARLRRWDALLGEAIHVPPPWLDPELYLVFGAYKKLGRDANGRTLFQEREQFLERSLSETGERDAYDQLFDQLEAESQAIQLDEWEAREEQQGL